MSFERAGERSKSKEEDVLLEALSAWVIFQNSHIPNGLLVINEGVFPFLHMPEMAPDRVLLGQQACLLNVDLERLATQAWNKVTARMKM